VFSIVLFGRVTRRVSFTALSLLGVWTVFGLYSARNIANYAQVAAIVTAPVAQRWLTATLPSWNARLQNISAVVSIGAGWAFALAVMALIVGLQASGVHLDARGEGNAFTTRAFPVGAADWIDKNPPRGEMFNEYTWGGYLEYRLFPAYRVFIDGDNDFFGEELVREYLDALNARGDWRAILDKYNVAWVILPPTRPLAQELMRSDEWREAYRDEGAGVWVKK
jgi:hypothetical protein